MIRQAQTTIQYSAQQHWLNFLIRHSFLLKVASWLGSFSLAIGAHVVSAEFKPPAAPPESAGNAQPSVADNSKNQSGSVDRPLHNDLLPANSLSVAGNSSASSHHYRPQVIAPLALQVPAAVNCQQRTPQLASSLCNQIRPQKQHKIIPSQIVTSAHQSVAPTKILPAVQPLPIVRSNPAPQARAGQSATVPLRFTRPGSSVSAAVAIQAAPLQSSVASRGQPASTAIQSRQLAPISKIPTVSKHTVPDVAPIPTVKVAAVAPNLAASSSPTVIPNYGVASDFIYPLASPAPITSRFGWRVHPVMGSRRFHSGMDFGAPEGAPIVAAATGRVVVANWHGGYGKAVVIEHNGKLQTLYGHMSEILVEEGQEVAQGTVIGRVGSTGRSTGAHLHFETQAATNDGWVAVDPNLDVQYALSNLQQSLQARRQNTAFAKSL